MEKATGRIEMAVVSYNQYFNRTCPNRIPVSNKTFKKLNDAKLKFHDKTGKKISYDGLITILLEPKNKRVRICGTGKNHYKPKKAIVEDLEPMIFIG